MGIEKKRIEWIDTAKFVGIYLMILGHTISKCNVYDGLHNFIYSFHMPLFFFLSGLTFSCKENLKKSFAKYFKQLLIPYLFFYFVDYLFWIFAFYLRLILPYDKSVMTAVVKPLFGMIMGRTTAYSFDVGKSIWFFVSLFSCKVIGRLFREIKNSKINLISELVFTIFSVVFTYGNRKWCIYLPLYLNETLMAYPFFYVAVKARKWNAVFNENSRKTIYYIIIVITLGLTIWLSTIQGYVGVRGCYLGESYNGLLFYPTAFLGMMLICSFSICLPKLNKTFRYLVQNTIIIVGFNRFIITLCITLFGRILLPSGWYFSLLISILTMGISLLPCFIINKYIPFVVGKSKIKSA